jgi:hypothetical protein
MPVTRGIAPRVQTPSASPSDFLAEPWSAFPIKKDNASERALRGVALGRKNYLFVWHNEAGANLAGLMSLLTTCEANGINPEEYLANVLLRVRTHPASRLDELLPHLWRPPDETTNEEPLNT